MPPSKANTGHATCPCPICHTEALFLDSVNFSKSCEEVRGYFLPPSDKLIDYFLCDRCGFCFAPEMHTWSFADFGQFIYNQDYALVDPDYKSARPEGNARLIDQLFANSKNQLRHLDYGGGSGLLSNLLQTKGWDSTTYDPFVNADVQVADLGSYDLVSAFEVFEHVTDMDGLLRNLRMLCKPDGLILFSTLLSDGEIARDKKLTWWYAGPRNGHISLFSAKSLHLCMQSSGFKLASFSANLHVAFQQVPSWASHLVQQPPPDQPVEPLSPLLRKLQEAITLHVDGQFDSAQRLYEDILAEQPEQHDALHLMGVLAIQSSNFERAVDFIGRAIAIHPDNFGFYINYGNALQRLDRLDAALASFDHAITLNPDMADLHLMRGKVLQGLQQWDAAMASFDRAIVLRPDFTEALDLRAHAVQEQNPTEL